MKAENANRYKSLQFFYVDKGNPRDIKRSRLKTKSAVANPINDFLDIKTDHKIAAIKICFCIDGELMLLNIVHSYKLIKRIYIQNNFLTYTVSETLPYREGILYHPEEILYHWEEVL